MPLGIEPLHPPLPCRLKGSGGSNYPQFFQQIMGIAECIFYTQDAVSATIAFLPVAGCVFQTRYLFSEGRTFTLPTL